MQWLRTTFCRLRDCPLGLPSVRLQIDSRGLAVAAGLKLGPDHLAFVEAAYPVALDRRDVPEEVQATTLIPVPARPA
jgi:hypothetical protein